MGVTEKAVTEKKVMQEDLHWAVVEGATPVVENAVVEKPNAEERVAQGHLCMAVVEQAMAEEVRYDPLWRSYRGA